MIDTSGFLTALECSKFVFGLGSVPDPDGETYSTTQTQGRGGEGREKRGRERREEKGREGKGKEGRPS